MEESEIKKVTSALSKHQALRDKINGLAEKRAIIKVPELYLNDARNNNEMSLYSWLGKEIHDKLVSIVMATIDGELERMRLLQDKIKIVVVSGEDVEIGG